MTKCKYNYFLYFVYVFIFIIIIYFCITAIRISVNLHYYCWDILVLVWLWISYKHPPPLKKTNKSRNKTFHKENEQYFSIIKFSFYIVHCLNYSYYFFFLLQNSTWSGKLYNNYHMHNATMHIFSHYSHENYCTYTCIHPPPQKIYILHLRKL